LTDLDDEDYPPLAPTADTIPAIGEHRGVKLNHFQSPERLAAVRADIDDAYALGSPSELARFALDNSRAPEARLLAAGKVDVLADATVRERRTLDLPYSLLKVRAAVAALDSLAWLDHAIYGSMLGHHEQGAVYRKRKLTDRELVDAASGNFPKTWEE
jgi:hypothetical protein